DVLGAAIELGVALLAAEALDLGDGDALHADGRERLADFVELEGLDDGGDEFHVFLRFRMGCSQKLPTTGADHALVGEVSQAWGVPDPEKPCGAEFSRGVAVPRGA